MSPPSLGTLLAGRVVAGVDPPDPAPAETAASPYAAAGPTWRVRFADGSTLAVRTDGTPPAQADAAAGRTVAAVHQRGTQLTLAFATGDPLAFRTAEASGCVLARDAAGRLAYAD